MRHPKELLQRPNGRCRRPEGCQSNDRFRVWLSGQQMRFFEKPHFTHFWASGLPAMCRPRDLESNALIGIEFCEFRQKLKNLEFLQNSSFWQSPGTIWIDFVSVEVVPSVFFCIFWVVWKFGREAPGLMRWDSVWCKDSSGPVAHPPNHMIRIG